MSTKLLFEPNKEPKKVNTLEEISIFLDNYGSASQHTKYTTLFDAGKLGRDLENAGIENDFAIEYYGVFRGLSNLKKEFITLDEKIEKNIIPHLIEFGLIYGVGSLVGNPLVIVPAWYIGKKLASSLDKGSAEPRLTLIDAKIKSVRLMDAETLAGNNMDRINENMPNYLKILDNEGISYSPKFDELNTFFNNIRSNKLVITKDKNFDYRHAIHRTYFDILSSEDCNFKPRLIRF